MDLYRYFHPHHNPRLRNAPLRAQELGELEIAALELERALSRAMVRTESSPVGGISAAHFEQLLVAANYLVESLSTLAKAHPGDSDETMEKILGERIDAPGWESWVQLVRERLKMIA